MDLQELKLIARQAYTLKENWDREAPRIVGAVRVMDCPLASQIVAVVPGANLVVLLSLWADASALICLDTSSAKRLDIIRAGSHLVAVSHPYEEQGTFVIAVTTGQQRG